MQELIFLKQWVNLKTREKQDGKSLRFTLSESVSLVESRQQVKVRNLLSQVL